MTAERGTPGSVALYCWPHNAVHRVTPGESERVIYALIGDLADERTEPSGLFVDEASHDQLACPLDMLVASRDSESYQEHVDQGVECRRALTAPAIGPSGKSDSQARP